VVAKEKNVYKNSKSITFMNLTMEQVFDEVGS